MTDQCVARPSQRKVSLSNIKTRPEEFQFRHIEVDERHVDDLAAVPKSGNALDPLTLWQDPTSGELVVVDGHHRLAAYRQADWQKKVPVVVHSCSLEDARLLALQENGKTRLALTSEERMDAAWALVCLGPEAYSKRIIVEHTGVSDGTVAKMRRTREELLGPDGEGFLPDSWRQAMDALRDGDQREFTDEDRQAMIDAKAAKLDDEIGKALGFMVSHQPEAACEVVAKRFGRQGLRFLIDYCAEELGIDVEEDLPF